MADTKKSQHSQNPKKDGHQPEFNERWSGYVFIGLTSLVNFASISNISRDERRSYWAASMAFGIVTFTLSVVILIQDRSQKCLETFHFTKARDGYFEGGTLGALVAWWIVGVAYNTRAGGIAYVASNIYYSSWLALGSCIYTLNEWSASKDILSIAELTSLSATLKSWWVVWLSSIVVFGTCIDLHVRLDSDEIGDTAYGIAVSFASSVISLFFLLVHYDFIPRCEEGGWFELSSSFFLVFLWIISLAILTGDQGIAATVTGSQCSRDDAYLNVQNCTITLYELSDDGTFSPAVLPCNDLPRQVPGSNLYYASWMCFFASLNISFRWKAQQALQLAQAQQAERQQQLTGGDTADPNSMPFSEADDENEEF